MSEWKETDLGIVPGNWEVVPAEKYCLRVTDGTHDSPKQQTTGKHLITSKHIKGKEIDFESAYLISEGDFNEINKRSKVDQWDLIISMIGEYCGFVYLETDKTVEYAVKNVGLFKVGNELNAKWLYYYFLSDIAKNQIRISKTGTSQPYLTLGSLREFPILNTTVKSEKETIVAILSSLDNKIDLLRRQNQTLEQLAQTIFKQWFIHYQYPGATGEMEETELGEVPKGWSSESLDKNIEFLNGLPLQKFPPNDENDFLPVIKIRELKSGVSGTTDKASSKIEEKYIVENGEVLFSWSGSLEVVLWNYGKGALNQHLFKVSSSKYPKWFYYLWLLHFLPKFKHIAQGKATTMGHIQRHHLTETLISIPPHLQFKEFDKTLSPIINTIILNSKEIQTLTQLRDSLLPRLMSGKLRVG